MSLEGLCQEFRDLQESERVGAMQHMPEKMPILTNPAPLSLPRDAQYILTLMPQEIVRALTCAGDLLTKLSGVPETDKERLESFAAGYLSIIQV